MTATRSNPLISAFSVLLLLLCLLFPETCAAGVKRGLETAALLALPALFPALVISRILSFTLGRKRGKGAFFLPFFLGLLCGFPVGAKTVSDLVKDKALFKEEGEKMLFFCNNTSPSFLIGICGEKLMGNALYGWFLFALQTCFSLFFFLIYIKRKKGQRENALSLPPLPFSYVLTESLKGAAESFLIISSCVLFFSYLLALLSLLPLSPLVSSILSLGLEITSGVKSLSGMEKKILFPLCAAGVGFGGCSVHAQSLSPMREANLKSRYYFLGKIFFSLSLFLGAEILLKCLSRG